MYQIVRIREVALCIPTVHFYYGILSRGVGTGPAGPVLAGPLFTAFFIKKCIHNVATQVSNKCTRLT